MQFEWIKKQKTNDDDVALWENDSSATESVTPGLPINAGQCAHVISR